MSDLLKFNPLTGDLDLVEHIPELDADPADSKAEDAWVLRSGSGGGSGGGKILAFLGLGFPMTAAGSGASLSYQLSYKTQNDTIKRVTLA